MTIHQSFQSFMEQEVLPARAANPGHRRLDGEIAGGNRSVFGVFRHAGRQWKVHADTHYEPLLLAYKALRTGEVGDPFVAEPTRSGDGTCLVLIEPLKQRMSDVRPKYLYVYEV